jgi:hypothetical protein
LQLQRFNPGASQASTGLYRTERIINFSHLAGGFLLLRERQNQLSAASVSPGWHRPAECINYKLSNPAWAQAAQPIRLSRLAQCDGGSDC